MKISAYILTGDPAWITTSVGSYYKIVDDIVVSYDRNRTGWTGLKIPVDESMDRLREIDVHKKMRWIAGDFYDPSRTPMENETQQRQAAIAVAGVGADWVLQLDNDEILPDARTFVRRLSTEISSYYVAVDWPLRVFFQRTPAGELLEISTSQGKMMTESVPIAVRPAVKLHRARRPESGVFRYRIPRPRTSLLHRLRRPQSDADRIIEVEEAILHLSWVRTEAEIRRKLSSFGHAHDFDWEEYLRAVWKVAPERWSTLHDFHPLVPAMWPALRPIRFPLPDVP